MNKNTKTGLWVGSILIVFFAGSWVYWRLVEPDCCEPPIEVIEQRDAEDVLKSAWEGHWDYYLSGDDGYSQGVNLRLFVEDNNVVGDFDAVWSFPGAPAARLNNGTLQVKSVKPDEIVAEWEGSREDIGQVILRLSADKQKLVWDGKLGAGAVDDGFALDGKLVFYRNQWTAWTPAEQAQFLQIVKDLLKKEGNNYTIQPGEDATIMVTGNYAVINAFVPDAPDEESGWVYLKRTGDEWSIVLGPKVQFSKTELDQAEIPEVMRYWVGEPVYDADGQADSYLRTQPAIGYESPNGATQ